MMFGHVETLGRPDRTLGTIAPIAGRNRRLHRLHLLDVSAGQYRPVRSAQSRGVRVSEDAGRRRLYLDNFANLQASWVTQGLAVGQLALRFGANDFGSLMIEENVVAAAGTTFRATEDEIRRRITTAGYSPRKRNVFYEMS